MLDDLRNNPTPLTLHRAMAATRDIPQRALKVWRDRKIPVWVEPMLSSLVWDTHKHTLLNLPETLKFDELADFIESEINNAVAQLIEPVAGDCLPQQPYTPDRGLAWTDAHRQYRGPNERQYADMFVPHDDDEMLTDFRARLEERIDQFFEVIRTSWDKRMVTALSMIWNGAKQTHIYTATRLTREEIEVRYTEALGALHEQHKRAG